MKIDLTNRVAIVTGAGAGLGREHALLLARLGAKVVVNDLGSDVNGNGGSATAAQRVVDEIVAAGGEAVASSASVTDYEQVQCMVDQALSQWGRVDILVNNAGILRDKSFSKMTLDDFRAVIEVHLMGAVNCSKAVWETMRQQRYGRIVMTTSSSGLYGNFGQSNYGAAKMALVGLMQTLAIEGERYDIRVNCLAPTAGTRMLEGLMSADTLDTLSPASVSPAVAVLAAEDAPSRMILCAGAGSFEAAHITLTPGIHLGTGDQIVHQLAQRLDEVTSRNGETVPSSGAAQGDLELTKARVTSANAQAHSAA
ncbi:SDR family NAD(P)-dependent oxidoreductase [Burkholderia stagnalis]|uniref:SDR family NAD(P)-dependent oxidoreductase n=1 Tax=Burkholderia stagnalis TaxID=1503054 RepID=UPI000F58099E|nr:SDR family NAD(P)-dependent oxidoreductase [Burkholderia stagnalis]RQR52536.1 SDR family NAD(P)-dependent oxidoreductase [Burkholderia sp. Bp9125]RQY22214.1 SDR family NAD(P)-dependent oxidoreductase [Burkholderia stagnalis]RQY92378.1 SDR family NAD(P)-dependent oxidoreductase [Burkholderia stagnalis]RQZ00198.1 SDR family NAD(P)-dependent oxidoreductase [Burkholderia stagnalis]